MIDIGSRTGRKLGILLILTTLTIGSAAGIAWENPAEGDNFKGTVTLNVSAPNSSSVTFYYDDGSTTKINNETSPSSGDYYTNSWDSANAGTGTFDLIAGNGTVNETISVTADFAKPTVSSFSPSDGGFTSNSDDLDVSYSASDGDSSVDFKNISISSENELDNDSKLSGLSLDDGSYTVDYWVNDSVGNVKTGSWDFTVDTEYDGDSNPSFEIEGESSGVVLFDDDKDMTVDFADTDSESDVTVTCMVGGEGVDSFTVTSDDPAEDDTTCSINRDDDEDYYDESVDVYLKMEDEAGNTAESDDETIAFDANKPSVSGLETSSNAELFNSNFDVEFAATDSASDIEEVEYFFSENTSEGEGTDIEYSSDQDTYEIDTSNLSAGDHTVYVRAKDEAGRWSSAPSVDFSFDPDAVPKVSLSLPDNVSVTAGEDGSFDVTVENTGKIHISSIELNASAGDVFSDSQSIADLEPDSSITATLDVSTEEADLGKYSITVSTDSPSKSRELNFVVEANSEQQSQVDSDLSEYQSKLQEIESNVTELKQKVSDSKAQRLESNFSSFRQKVEDAQSAVQKGEYYKAESLLENIDQDYSAAERSYSTVRKEYENNRFWMMIFLGIGGVVVLGAGVVGGLSYTDEVDFDVRDYLEDLQELEIDTSSLEEIPDKFKRMLQGKDTSDAEDFEWDGFNN